MPHKRNPITLERITGLSRLVRAHAVAALENVALWHERDISHSSVERVIIPDGTIAVHYMARCLWGVLKGLRVNAAKMKECGFRAKISSHFSIRSSSSTFLGIRTLLDYENKEFILP